MEGLIASVGLSLLWLISKNARPHTAILGRLPNSIVYRDVKRFPMAEEIKGIKIFRFDASLNFSNADYFESKISRLLRLCEKQGEENDSIRDTPVTCRRYVNRKRSNKSNENEETLSNSSNMPERHLTVNDLLRSAPLDGCREENRRIMNNDAEWIDSNDRIEKWINYYHGCLGHSDGAIELCALECLNIDLNNAHKNKNETKILDRQLQEDFSTAISIMIPPKIKDEDDLEFDSKIRREDQDDDCDLIIREAEEDQQRSLNEESNKERTKVLIIDASSINDLDVTALRMIKKLSERIKARGIQLLFSSFKGTLRDVLKQARFYETVVSPQHCFLSLHDAVVWAEAFYLEESGLSVGHEVLYTSGRDNDNKNDEFDDEQKIYGKHLDHSNMENNNKYEDQQQSLSLKPLTPQFSPKTPTAPSRREVTPPACWRFVSTATATFLQHRKE